MTEVRETNLDAEGLQYEQRYTTGQGKNLGAWTRRPVSVRPRDGTVAIVDDGSREGAIKQRDFGVFEAGQWSGAAFTPTHWTVDERRKRNSRRKGR